MTMTKLQKPLTRELGRILNAIRKERTSGVRRERCTMNATGKRHRYSYSIAKVFGVVDPSEGPATTEGALR